jgi:hypothetical protein
VGSIPIHPHQFSAALAAMTAKMTAKTTNGFLNRLRPWRIQGGRAFDLPQTPSGSIVSSLLWAIPIEWLSAMSVPGDFAR